MGNTRFLSETKITIHFLFGHLSFLLPAKITNSIIYVHASLLGYRVKWTFQGSIVPSRRAKILDLEESPGDSRGQIFQLYPLLSYHAIGEILMIFMARLSFKIHHNLNFGYHARL